jgi:hypothetical protein
MEYWNGPSGCCIEGADGALLGNGAKSAVDGTVGLDR